MLLLLEPQNPIPYIIIILVIIAIGIGSFYFSKKQRILRKLNKFHTRRVIQFRTNELTKITGKTLHVHEPLIAPLSGRRCVAYLITVKKKRNTGKSSSWHTVLQLEEFQDFFIEENGEVVLVQPRKSPKKNYDAFLVQDHSVRSGFLNDPTPEFESFLRTHDIDSTNLLGFNKTLEYSERVIELGEIVTVGGIAKWKEVNEQLSDYSYTRIAALESSDKQKIVITDHYAAKPKNKR